MSRSEELKTQYRSVLLISFTVALAIHGFVILANPSFTIDTPESRVAHVQLELVAGVPGVVTIDGAATESARALSLVNEFQMQTALLTHWPSSYRAYSVGGSATVRVLVDSLGRAVQSSLVEASGDIQKDEAFRQIALQLRYSWSGEEPWPKMARVDQPLMVDELPAALQVW